MSSVEFKVGDVFINNKNKNRYEINRIQHKNGIKYTMLDYYTEKTFEISDKDLIEKYRKAKDDEKEIWGKEYTLPNGETIGYLQGGERKSNKKSKKTQKQRRNRKQMRGGDSIIELNNELKKELISNGITYETYNDNKAKARQIVNEFVSKNTKNTYIDTIQNLMDITTGVDLENNNMLHDDKILELLRSNNGGRKKSQKRKQTQKQRRNRNQMRGGKLNEDESNELIEIVDSLKEKIEDMKESVVELEKENVEDKEEDEEDEEDESVQEEEEEEEDEDKSKKELSKEKKLTENKENSKKKLIEQVVDSDQYGGKRKTKKRKNNKNRKSQKRKQRR